LCIVRVCAHCRQKSGLINLAPGNNDLMNLPWAQDGDLERLDIDPLEQSFARLADERQEYLDLKKAANSESMPIVTRRLKPFWSLSMQFWNRVPES